MDIAEMSPEELIEAVESGKIQSDTYNSYDEFIKALESPNQSSENKQV